MKPILLLKLSRHKQPPQAAISSDFLSFFLSVDACLLFSTFFLLLIRLGINNIKSAKKMIENQTDSIHFDTLDKLSTLLNVPIGDLFEKTNNDSEL